jgi:hypothetical protein
VTAKTAPVLSALMQDLSRQANEPRKKSHPMPGDARVARMATAELRALVAVAREARRFRSWDYSGSLARALKRLDTAAERAA